MNDIRGKLVEYKLLRAQKCKEMENLINELLALDKGWQPYSKVMMRSPKETGHDYWNIHQEMARFEPEAE